MTTANIVLTGNVSGGPVGNRTFGPSAVTSANAVDATQVVTVSTNTTITVPTGATGVFIAGPNAVSPIPNPTYGGVLSLKSVAGDAGIPISAKWPQFLAWDSAPASFVLNATVSCVVELWFF